MDAMIDIETLDTCPDSVILSIGACKFDPYTHEDPIDLMLWRPDLDSQLAVGRAVSDSTLEWWAKQEKSVVDEGFSSEGRMAILDVCAELNKYLVGVNKIWCQGPQFDMVIIENLYAQYGHHKNWAYWQIMDCRTVFNMMPADPRKAIQQNAHSAAYDAYYQAKSVQTSFSYLNVVPRIG